MRLRSTRTQTVHMTDLNLTVPLAAGEDIRTEISAKLRRETMVAEVARAGLQLRRWWTDENNDFALSLYDLP